MITIEYIIALIPPNAPRNNGRIENNFTSPIPSPFLDTILTNKQNANKIPHPINSDRNCATASIGLIHNSGINMIPLITNASIK